MTPVVRAANVNLRYGKTLALDDVSLEIAAGVSTSFIGPDGVGKSSFFSLISGARAVQSGEVEVLDGEMTDRAHRRAVCPRIAYMPQGLGKNLYPTLSVFENADFFGGLFGQSRAERKRRIEGLLDSVGLGPFAARPAGKLSGGMKQKLGLCCALIHDPDLLILDEPTTGVDPLSRRQFWELVDRIRAERPHMTVLVATAYMDEAALFERLVVMNGGRVLATGTPQEVLARTGSSTLEEAFIALLPEEQRKAHRAVVIPPREKGADDETAIEARGLTMRFGSFTAVDHASFRIARGEIFGFLGSNGCGKTTTMKMLTGLLDPTEGEARLFGKVVDAGDIATRRRVGFMTQAFSLYGELTVRQNLFLHARLFGIAEAQILPRVQELARRFGLAGIMDELPEALPLGHRQRLSLAVAIIHGPEMLILDEPTSGVDPVARDAFWEILVELARHEKVTIFVSTHFMNEAERCDRISFMHAGHVLVSDTPKAVVAKRGVKTLEDAFISYLEEATAANAPQAKPTAPPSQASSPTPPTDDVPRKAGWFSLRRMASYAHREAVELARDPIRLGFAILGSMILMFVISYGLNLDVENLSFAVLDRDQTGMSRDYGLNVSGSRYFITHAPIQDYDELDRRMRSGELSVAIEIPPGFARDVERGRRAEIAAWFDGAMPSRAETVRAYIEGMHVQWLEGRERELVGRTAGAGLAGIEPRFRYNPDIESLPAMVPAALALLLLVIPAMLGTLSIVREKELGSIVNLYVTPTSRLEFLLGKQLPYVVLAMMSFLLLTALAVWAFGVPLKGSFLALACGALLYVIASTALGLVVSGFTSSQMAALFATVILTILPAQSYSGLIDPVPSLEGLARRIGEVYPMTHFLELARGAFSKALGFAQLRSAMLPLAAAAIVLIAAATALIRKQDG